MYRRPAYMPTSDLYIPILATYSSFGIYLMIFQTDIWYWMMILQIYIRKPTEMKYNPYILALVKIWWHMLWFTNNSQLMNSNYMYTFLFTYWCMILQEYICLHSYRSTYLEFIMCEAHCTCMDLKSYQKCISHKQDTNASMEAKSRISLCN